MTTEIIRIVFLLAIFAAAFLLFQTVGRAVAARRAHTVATNRRMSLIQKGTAREDLYGELLKNRPREHEALPPLLRRMAIGFEHMIYTSGISWSISQVLVAMAVAIGLLFIIALGIAVGAGAEIGFGAIQLCLLFAIAAGAGIPYFILKQVANSRRKTMEKQFPVALDIFVRALRSGHPVASAIELLTQEMEDPIGSEFGLVSDEITYGADLTTALDSMADRWKLEDMRMFVVSLSVQSETGGNLAEILENLAGVIRDRAAMYMKVRALSSEGRMTGWMLSILPIFAFVTTFLGAPEFYLDVAEDPIFIFGSIFLILLYFVGVFAIRKLVDLKV
ncbi:type II secretion system F family protein [Qipengyuania aquimaris]|uniref:type II secretion system F family protein n=1 Tax=Qipengyuania aquimaris TaxID=255984 RepID=UPI001CD42D98|nr:type II secretion system F family protein [Qipengyuania aquimaris]MCA0903697.1 type II secretion system F family protein [Qipengyuania aquimaris]